VEPNETLHWLLCLPDFGPWKHHSHKNITWLLDVHNLLHCIGFYNMASRVAQENVKHTVNTILGGQATTTFQKAAQKNRVGRKNVSLQTTTVQRSKGFQTTPVLERTTVQGPIQRNDSRKSGQLHLFCWLEVRFLGRWVFITVVLYLLEITVKKSCSNV